MSEEIHRKLVAFLGGEFARAEGRQCVRFELVSAQPGLRGDPIRTWDRSERPEIFDGLANIEALVTEIIRLAADHADSFGGGSHRFEVRTEQHLGGRQKSSFRILVDESAGEPSGGDDAPTATGLVGQLMRHLEVNARTQAGMYQTTIGTMSRMIQDLADEARALRSDRNSRFDELEEARSRQADRDLEGMRQVASDRRKDEAFGKIMQLVPIAASRMLSGGSGSGSGAGAGKGSGQGAGAGEALTILANELTDSLSPEQFAQIAGALGVNQKILLAELFRIAQQNKAAGQAAPALPTQPGDAGQSTAG